MTKRGLIVAAVVCSSFGVAAFAADKPAPKVKPKITMAQARKTALAKEPGKVKSQELENEKGKLIYSFDIQGEKDLHEVAVDAMTGEVVEDTVEDPAKEAQEQAEEKAKKAHKKAAHAPNQQ